MTDSLHRSIRIPQQDLEQIDQLAKHHGLNRSQYLIAAALDRLPAHTSRIDDLEQRLERLEERVNLAY